VEKPVDNVENSILSTENSSSDGKITGIKIPRFFRDLWQKSGCIRGLCSRFSGMFYGSIWSKKLAKSRISAHFDPSCNQL
jgi:hypothetical protein